MGGISDDAIRKRAYHIWEREGRPHGHDFEHWVRAQVELVAEARKHNAGRPAPPPVRARAGNAKTPAAKPGRTASARPARPKKPA
jgi:hypothetical protein